MLSRSNLMAKVAILLVVPVVFEFTVISLSIQLLDKIDSARVERQAIVDVLFKTINMMNFVTSRSTSLLQAVDQKGTVSDEVYADHFDSIGVRWDDLADSAKSAGIDMTDLNSYYSRFRRRFNEQNENLPETISVEKIKNKYAHTAEALTDLVAASERFISRRVEEVEGNESKELELQSRMQLLLIVALGFSVPLTLMLGFLIANVVISRLNIIRENTRRLANQEKLLPDLNGNDEIAFLDRNFRTMARALSEARAKDRAILQNSVDVICAIGRDLELSRVSQSSNSLWGRESQDLEGTSVTELISSDTLQLSLREFERAADTNSTVTFENTLKDAKGEDVACLWSVNWSEQDQSYMCVVHDLRDRKYASEQRQQLMEVVSHDLRTPLTVIKLSLEILLSGQGATFDKTVRKQFEEVQLAIKQSVELINDLLDLFKVQADRLELELTLFSFADMVELLQVHLKDLDLNLSVGSKSEELLLIDQDYFPRIVYNLVKHLSLASGERKISLRLEHDAGNEQYLFSIEPLPKGAPSKVLTGLQSPQARLVSMEVSLTLGEEIARLHRGVLEIGWQVSGQPVYCLRMPAIDLR